MDWFRPGLPLLLGTSAVVVAGAALGMPSLRAPWLGLPAGLWLIGAAQAAAWAARRAAERPWPFADDPAAVDEDVVEKARRLGASVAAAGVETVEASALALGVPRESLARAEAALTSRIDHADVQPAPLRIGVEGRAAFTALSRAAVEPAGVRVAWVELDPGASAARSVDELHLDALVTIDPETSAALVRTPEGDGRDAAWYDWSAGRPLLYMNVFPVRTDCARANLGRVDWGRPEEAGLAAALTIAAAALSRTPARLGLPDRARGRLPAFGQAAGGHGDDPMRTAGERALEALGDRLDALPEAAPITEATRAAARVVSAWAASTDEPVALERRARWAACAHRVAGDEAEVLLRAAAVGFAAGDEPWALTLIESAKRACDARADRVGDDPMAFVQAELDTAGASPLTLGRLCAGVCLACAGATPDRVAHLGEDFFDDARYTTWLVGRDQDRAALMQVFRRLEGRRTPAPAPIDPAPAVAGSIAPAKPTRRKPKRAESDPKRGAAKRRKAA